MNGRFEIGQKLSRLLESEPGFLRIGVPAAVLKEKGTIPVVREEGMISVMKGDREEKVALTRTVGRGSSLQVEDLDF